MVLEIAADARQVDLRRDPRRAQPAGIANAGELQQLRGVDRATGENDFLAGGQLHHLIGDGGDDAGRAAILQPHAMAQCFGHHGEIAAVHGRAQEGVGSAPAARPVHRHLVGPEAVLLWTVEVFICRILELAACLQEHFGQRIELGDGLDVERAIAAVQRSVEGVVVFVTLETLERVGPAPGRVAGQLAPFVEIFLRATHVMHGINRGGSA